jgi:hypothetical protein
MPKLRPVPKEGFFFDSWIFSALYPFISVQGGISEEKRTIRRTKLCFNGALNAEFTAQTKRPDYRGFFVPFERTNEPVPQRFCTGV